MKGIIGMATCPVLLLVGTSSREQYSKPTLGGIWYLALKPSIPAEESTSFSSLPILLNLGKAKKVYLKEKAGNGSGREVSTYESRDLKSLELVKNSPGIFKGVFVGFGMPCEGKRWNALGRLNAFFFFSKTKESFP